MLQATPGYAPAYELGGPIQSLEGLDDHLVRLGVLVRVLTTDSGGRARLNVHSGWRTWRGRPVRYVRRWFRPDVTPAYLPLALSEAMRTDVVHVTGVFSVPSIQALIASVAVGRPIVLSTRGALEPEALRYGPSGAKRAWLAAFGWLLERVTIFHVTSKTEAESVRRTLGSSVQLSVVPNGVDLPEEATALAQPAADGLPTIGFLGRIHPVKALERLLDAAALLKARDRTFRLDIAGPTVDRNYMTLLESRVRQLDLQDVVSFRGELRGDAKRAFYTRCRVFVLPSVTENFGNVVPEALSHGVPVIASRSTPWSELEDTGAGRWVDNSPKELAAAIEPFLLDPTRAARAGASGRALVERSYTWEASARSMVAVYRRALAIHAQTHARGARS